jgi:hypothetical protein
MTMLQQDVRSVGLLRRVRDFPDCYPVLLLKHAVVVREKSRALAALEVWV